MLTVIVTSAVGTPPFQISLCDVTNTYCYIVGVDVTSFPVTLIVPPPIQSADTLLIKIKDAYYCETLQTTTSLSPTPTPTPTLTPSSYITNCNCIKFDNLDGVLDYYFSVTLCDGTEINSTIFSGTTLYYCGNSPTAEPEVGISIGPVCVDNTCPTPVYTPTLTSTPTLTNTPTLTQTPTLTSSSVPTNTPTPTLTNTPVSTNTPTPTPTPTQTNTPTSTATPTPTPTLTPTSSETFFLLQENGYFILQENGGKIIWKPA